MRSLLHLDIDLLVFVVCGLRPVDRYPLEAGFNNDDSRTSSSSFSEFPYGIKTFIWSEVRFEGMKSRMKMKREGHQRNMQDKEKGARNKENGPKCGVIKLMEKVGHKANFYQGDCEVLVKADEKS